jgi:hypothetical protein
MIPLRLVIDTNIIVSAALKPDRLQRTVFLLGDRQPAAFSEVLEEDQGDHVTRIHQHRGAASDPMSLWRDDKGLFLQLALPFSASSSSMQQ